MSDRDYYDDWDEYAFRFEGSWREYLPIALVNLLLTIVTIGVFRFWATARERRYLWSRTVLFEDPLEWQGKGLELFLGTLLALPFFAVPVYALQLGVQALIGSKHEYWAYAVMIGSYLILYYMTGVARFRALRYRLSRTSWRGIRGGSDENGLAYGVTFVWKKLAGYVPLALAVPWSMISLWNQRFRAMSFGSLPFEANAEVRPIMKPYYLCYLVPFFLAVVGVVELIQRGTWLGHVYIYADAPLWMTLTMYVLIAISIYWLIAIIGLAYYSAFMREAVGGLSLGGARFGFNASAGQWMTLFLVDFLIVFLTLGIGWFFLGYRHWKFFADHVEIRGEIDVDSLTQTRTKRSSHGEGLMDALDIGAF